jgi:hypothetical protein
MDVGSCVRWPPECVQVIGEFLRGRGPIVASRNCEELVAEAGNPKEG